MFKRKKKKTGCETLEFRKSTPPPPPTSGSNAVKPNISYGHQPIYTSTQNPPDTFSSLLKSAPIRVLPNDVSTVDYICTYETPCGWCCKWDKKCDKKIPERGLRANCNFMEDAIDSTDADIDYVRFRQSVCAYCPDLNCMRSQVEICDCHKFRSYYELEKENKL